MKRHEQGHSTVLMDDEWTRSPGGYAPGMPQQKKAAVEMAGSMLYVGTMQRPAYGKQSNALPGFFRADWGSKNVDEVCVFIKGHPYEAFYTSALDTLKIEG